jgi:hypothetical protein
MLLSLKKLLIGALFKSSLTVGSAMTSLSGSAASFNERRESFLAKHREEAAEMMYSRSLLERSFGAAMSGLSTPPTPKKSFSFYVPSSVQQLQSPPIHFARVPTLSAFSPHDSHMSPSKRFAGSWNS